MQNIKAKADAEILARCKVNYAAGSWGQHDSLAVIKVALEAADPKISAEAIEQIMAVANMMVNPAAAHGALVSAKLLKDLGRKRGAANKFAGLAAAATQPPAKP